jgi:hypothetical protein
MEKLATPADQSMKVLAFPLVGFALNTQSRGVKAARVLSN